MVFVAQVPRLWRCGVKHRFVDGTQHYKKMMLQDTGEDNGHLTDSNNLYVPDHEPLHLHLMQEHHDPPAMGHLGRAKTLKLLQRKYYWPQMRNNVMRYIRNCHTCQCARTSRHAPHGVLRLLAVPDQPWQDISTDFVTGLPSAQGYDAIWVIVDRFTKQHHLIPCTTTIDGEGFAELFIKEVFRLHGLPQTVTSDRGPEFIAAFSKCPCKRLDMQPRLSSPYYSQTDGKTECLNAVMEEYL